MIQMAICANEIWKIIFMFAIQNFNENSIRHEIVIINLKVKWKSSIDLMISGLKNERTRKSLYLKLLMTSEKELSFNLTCKWSMENFIEERPLVLEKYDFPITNDWVKGG